MTLGAACLGCVSQEKSVFLDSLCVCAAQQVTAAPGVREVLAHLQAVGSRRHPLRVQRQLRLALDFHVPIGFGRLMWCRDRAFLLQVINYQV